MLLIWANLGEKSVFQKAGSSSGFTIIAGNWKMYKTIEEAKTFVETLTPLLEKSQVMVYLAVPFTAIHATSQLVKKLDAPIAIGAQNMHDVSKGAFTGEIAAPMLKEAGAHFVILGHSERRHFFNESDCFINKKVKRALKESIQPILCIGENLTQREKGETQEVLHMQLLESLKDVSSEDLAKIIFAYEPVWAIGTGKVAHPDDVEMVHTYVRDVIAENFGTEVADHIVIQYGGSVQPDNAVALLSQPNVNGLLVGGASLSAETFSQIINGAQI